MKFPHCGTKSVYIKTCLLKQRKYTFTAQCGNFIIFLSSRFYVKSVFWDSRSANSTILTHLEALNCDFYEFLHFLKAKINQKSKLRISKIVKKAYFALLESSKLISRKISVIQKSSNFHTVLSLPLAKIA